MKLRIKNFGPIKNGFVDDQFMEITDLTMIIGPPSSGKSTNAKVLSTLIWIEKALAQGDLTDKELKLPWQFKTYFDFHNIRACFNDDFVVEYVGEAHHFTYCGESKLDVERVVNFEFVSIPKIMFVPSERHILSVIPTRGVIRNLPPSFVAFLDEFNKAQKALGEDLQLPMDGASLSCDRLTA